MNKLSTFLLLVIIALVCYLITLYNIFGIRDLTSGIISAIVTQVPSSPWALITGVGTTLASVGTVAWKAVSSFKTKAQKQISQIKWDADNKVSDANNQTSSLIQEKEDLQKRIEELEMLPDERKALEAANAQKDQQIEKLRRDQETLMKMAGKGLNIVRTETKVI